MMAALDSNFWGFIAVPVGVVLGFGAALVVWLKAELRRRPSEETRKKP